MFSSFPNTLPVLPISLSTQVFNLFLSNKQKKQEKWEIHENHNTPNPKNRNQSKQAKIISIFSTLCIKQEIRSLREIKLF